MKSLWTVDEKGQFCDLHGEFVSWDEACKGIRDCT